MRNTKVTIIDYGMGNIRSVSNAFAFLGCRVEVTSEPAVVDQSEFIVLPGVGAFGDAMHNLKALHLIDPLNRQVIEHKKPFLGICLGMQLIANESEEKGLNQGLGWIPGRVIPIKADPSLRIPHMGWNEIIPQGRDEFLDGFHQGLNFYFVHSFYLQCENQEDVHSNVLYGNEITASVRKDNIFAVQFHPERSHHNGLRLLEKYLKDIESQEMVV